MNAYSLFRVNNKRNRGKMLFKNCQFEDSERREGKCQRKVTGNKKKHNSLSHLFPEHSAEAKVRNSVLVVWDFVFCWWWVFFFNQCTIYRSCAWV